MTQQPDHTRITVLTNGNPKGLIASTPAGGHITPISGEGLSPA